MCPAAWTTTDPGFSRKFLQRPHAVLCGWMIRRHDEMQRFAEQEPPDKAVGITRRTVIPEDDGHVHVSRTHRGGGLRRFSLVEVDLDAGMYCCQSA